ncbi:MAG: alkaline phosphatase [Saprospiraceae bacterium]|nr:alkaline phosphatase [Saprospiraceae bacterium]
MIGDGMGLTQISAGMYMNGNKLHLEEFPVIGLHKSYSYNDLITDSAAGAVAFASGIKTYNGAIGVNADTIAVQTILEDAEAHGLATGLIATSKILHATPACFFAHQKSRTMYEEIAADLLLTDMDLFIGGGKKYFDQRTLDNRNLIEELQEKGYVISDYFQQDFNDSLIMDPAFNFGYLTALDAPLPAAAGRDYLTSASARGIEFLQARSPENGFFLMIEGSQIDWGGHANDSDYIISEMIDFDRAIGTVMDFAKKDGNTLVIVTADHETGGYAINPGSTMDSLVTAFTTGYHTGCLIPVFAFGPGSNLFSGIYENTAIYDKMRLAFQFDKLK